MLDDLSFLHQSHFPECSTHVAKHFEGYWTIQLATTGRLEIAYDGTRSLVEAPVVWTCYPGPFIEFRPVRPKEHWNHRYLAFLGPRVANWRSEGLWFDGSRRLSPALAERLSPRFDEAIDAAERGGRWGLMCATSLLDTILVDLAEARERAPEPRPSWLAQAMAELANLSAPEPDCAALARRHGMALSTLRARFKQATGVPLHSYRLACRIARARKLLSTTDQPIKQIAGALGYNDIYYFTRQFSKEVGLPPMAYRKAARLAAQTES